MIITWAIIIFTTVTSLIAFPTDVSSIDSIRKPEWFDKFKFNALAIFKYKEFHRFITYGFIHASWMHLLFNMFTLYFFAGIVEKSFGAVFGKFGGLIYLGFYFLALVVSTLADFIKYRNSSYYNAVGASGAVSAILFTSILLYPNMKIMFILLPIPITAWFFGLLFIAYSIFMAKRNMDNIGHSAHIWGAFFGFVFPIIFYPQLFSAFLEQIL
ncbi:MAG: rhomboid family intramembrane serine protease [Bacteroidota bacterium]|nr:rhomboid family intramembrane serine protease [Bacteroidota bacterium]